MTCLTVAIVAWQDITKLGLHNNLWFVTFLTINNNNAPLTPSNRIYPTTKIRNGFTSLFLWRFPKFFLFLVFFTAVPFPRPRGKRTVHHWRKKHQSVSFEFFHWCWLMIPYMLVKQIPSIESWFQDLYEMRCWFISLFLSLLQVDSWFQGQVSTSEYWMVEKHTS